MVNAKDADRSERDMEWNWKALQQMVEEESSRSDYYPLSQHSPGTTLVVDTAQR